MCGKGGFRLVMNRGDFIYICKRHHLEYFKPPTPRRATLGRAPDSQQSGPGWIPPFTKFVYKEGGRGRSSPAVPPPSVWEAAAQRVQAETCVPSPGRVVGWTFLGRCNATGFRGIFRLHGSLSQCRAGGHFDS